MENAQAEHVLGEEVVLDQPSVLGLVLRDDGEVLVVQQHTTLGWFPVLHVKQATLFDHLLGHEQANRAVDRPATPGDLGIGVLGCDLIVQEVRRRGAGVLWQPRPGRNPWDRSENWGS